jgi:L-lactate dehydrogenase complex protein LldG
MVFKAQKMNSRAAILQAIGTNKPGAVPLPQLPVVPVDVGPVVRLRQFVTMLEFIGGTVVEINDLSTVIAQYDALQASGKLVASTVQSLGDGNFNIDSNKTASELEAIDTAFIPGSWGIAENGAIWLFESGFKNRLLPFICQHLVIILQADKIRLDMHEAYHCIDVSQEGYGLFLAGPSKTADIEQSLVIGAHGARSCTVYLLHPQS